MRRTLLVLLAVLVVLLAVNTVVTNRETKSAKADVGRIIDLPGGDLQVREDGRATRPTSSCCTASPARSAGGRA